MEEKNTISGFTLFIGFVLVLIVCLSTFKFLSNVKLNTIQDVINAEMKGDISDIPCEKMSRPLSPFDPDYKMVSVDEMMLYELDTGHRFSSCRPEIQDSMTIRCASYSRAINNNLNAYLNRKYPDIEKYLSQVCEGKHFETLSNLAPELKVDKTRIKIVDATREIVLTGIASVGIADLRVDDIWIMDLSISNGDRYIIYYKNKDAAESARNLILDTIRLGSQSLVGMSELSASH